MVATAEVAVLVLLAVGFIRWFRRKPLYRAHRRTGVVPGRPVSSHVSLRFHEPTQDKTFGYGQELPLRPELRPDVDPVPPPVRRRWAWFGRKA
jgi:hypothetical protein